MDCVEAIHAFVQADHRNVAAIHCKAGKGRTGLVCASYLLHARRARSARDALALYGQRRTLNGKGVTIPSQARYVGYYERFLRWADARGAGGTAVPRSGHRGGGAGDTDVQNCAVSSHFTSPGARAAFCIPNFCLLSWPCGPAGPARNKCPGVYFGPCNAIALENILAVFFGLARKIAPKVFVS